MMRTVGIALKDVRALPLRNALTALSMLLGVLVIASISAADQLVVGAVVAQHEQDAGREATYELFLPGVSAGSDEAAVLLGGVRDRLRETDATTILVRDDTLTLRGDAGPGTTISTSWIDGDLHGVYRRPVIAGAWGTASSTTVPVVALNERAADRLGTRSVPTTLMWTVPSGTARTVVVTAVVADGKDEAQAYARLTDDAPFGPGTAGAGGAGPGDARLLISSAGTPESLVRQVVTDSAVHAGLGEVPEVRRVDTVARTRDTVELVGLAFLVCALVSLAVAVVGILNVGLASVTERARELVVRRALGARRRDLVAQVLGSALVVSASVAALAVGAVLVAVYLVAPRFTSGAVIADPVEMPWAAVVNGTLAALLTGVVGSLAPAIKACRLPVADALRA